MKFKTLESHDVKNIIRENRIESFTKQSFLIAIDKGRTYKHIIYSVYYIENVLQELVAEGYLVATYSSVVINSEVYLKTGSKPVATYNVKKGF